MESMDGVLKFKNKFKPKAKKRIVILPGIEDEPQLKINMLDLSSQMISMEAMAAVAEMLETDEIAK